MKIIFIINDITRPAGTEKATVLLANSFVKKGFEVEIISIASHQNSSPFFQLSSAVKIHHVTGTQNRILNFLKIRKILHTHNPDIICGTGHNISFFLPFIKNSKSKTIALEHIESDAIPAVSKFLMKLVYPKLDAVVVLSEAAKIKLNKITNRITVIPNQIITGENYSQLVQEKIILVGRISEEKAYERLLPISKMLQNKFPLWKIDIYGKGDDQYQDVLKKLFKENDVKNITIHDPIKNIDEKFLESSVFMITSKREAFGMVILEAKSFGLPVIGFCSEGANNLIIDGKDGYIVANEEEAICKLELLISDINLRRELGNNGIKNVKEFGEEKVISEWLELVNAIY